MDCQQAPSPLPGHQFLPLTPQLSPLIRCYTVKDFSYCNSRNLHRSNLTLLFYSCYNRNLQLLQLLVVLLQVECRYSKQTIGMHLQNSYRPLGNLQSNCKHVYFCPISGAIYNNIFRAMIF